jgi:hypothetical protein
MGYKGGAPDLCTSCLLIQGSEGGGHISNVSAAM